MLSLKALSALFKRVKLDGALVHDRKQSFALYALPKNANTSTKIMMHYAITGEMVEDEITTKTGKAHRIHRVLDTRSKSAYFSPCSAAIRVAVVRDPVKRFVSAFQDKVMDKSWIDQDVSIEQFIANIDQYMSSRKLENHFEPQYLYLGEDPAQFTHIISTSELNNLATLMSGVYGKRIDVPSQNASKATVNVSEDAKAWIRDVWAKKDYELGYC